MASSAEGSEPRATGHAVPKVVAPSRYAEAAPRRPPQHDGECQRRPRMILPLVGSPSARSMTGWDRRRTSVLSAVSVWRRSAAKDSANVNVGSPMDSRRDMAPTPTATLRASGREKVSSTSPAMAMASDAWSPKAVQSSRNSSKRSPAARVDSKGDPAQHGARSNAHGHPIRFVGGQCIGDLPRALPTQSRRSDVAVDRHAPGSHVPAESGVTSPAASRCSAISAAFSLPAGSVLRLRRPSAGAARRGRFELRFVGHRADQRVVEHELRWR